MKKAVVILTLLLCAVRFVCAEEVTSTDDKFVSLLKTDDPNGPEIAAALAETFLTQKQFRDEVEKLRSKYEDWEKDTQGDMGRYLNDRLVMVALGAANGKVERIQRGILWLAFYKEFDQVTPAVVAKFLREHSVSLNSLFKDFTWEKASQYIKNKEWRKDIEGRRKAAENQLAPERPIATALVITQTED